MQSKYKKKRKTCTLSIYVIIGYQQKYFGNLKNTEYV